MKFMYNIYFELCKILDIYKMYVVHVKKSSTGLTGVEFCCNSIASACVIISHAHSDTLLYQKLTSIKYILYA